MIMFYFILILTLVGLYKLKTPLFLILTGATPSKDNHLTREFEWKYQVSINHFLLKDLSEEFVIIKKSKNEFTVISRTNETNIIKKIIPSLFNERPGEKFLSPIISIIMSVSVIQKAFLTIFLGALSDLFIRPFLDLNRVFLKWRFYDLKTILSDESIMYVSKRLSLNQQIRIFSLEFLGVTPSLLSGSNEKA